MGKIAFGELVRQARTHQGIPLRQLASQVGLSPSRLSRIERGLRPPPPLPQLRSLAQALNLPLDRLLQATGTPKEVLDHLCWSRALSAPSADLPPPLQACLSRKNTFLTPVISQEGALKRVQLGKVCLQVVSFSRKRRLKIVIPPEVVLLLPPQPPPQVSTPNLFPAEVKRLRLVGDLTNAVLSCPGFELNSLLPNASSHQLGLRKGCSLWAAVPVAAIRVCEGKEAEG